MSEKVRVPAPWQPAPYIEADIYALKKLSTGEATPEQQKRALDWIIKTLSGTYDLSFRHDSERVTAFAEGKRFVGLQIVKLINLPVALLAKGRTK